MEGHPIFQRSELLLQNLLEIADHPLYDDSRRLVTSADFCMLSLEHAESVRTLAQNGLHASGIALMRIQFETLLRAIWMFHCASDDDLEKITSRLTTDTQDAAGKMPAATKMLEALGKNPATLIPFDSLSEFKEHSWKPLNSYIHAGIHPLAQHRGGYPMQFIEQRIKLSNGLVVISVMHLCVLTGNGELQKQISPLHTRFADCLPDHRNSV
ncbi:MAG: hypothetical protein V4673_12470 [Pseudomonadota bacterium]